MMTERTDLACCIRSCEQDPDCITATGSPRPFGHDAMGVLQVRMMQRRCMTRELAEREGTRSKINVPTSVAQWAFHPTSQLVKHVCTPPPPTHRLPKESVARLDGYSTRLVAWSPSKSTRWSSQSTRLSTGISLSWSS